MSQFIYSSKKSPCPVCGRDSDGDCRMREQENLVLCHTHIDNPGDILNNYQYLKRTDDSMWGVFVYNERNQKGELKGKKIRSGEKRSEFLYPNRDGSPFIKIEKVKQGSEKAFYQYHWLEDHWESGLPGHIRAPIPIYRYIDCKQAIANGEAITIVEGETSADALWAIGIPATTFLGGAKKYRSYGKGYKDDLSGAAIILCPDRDKAGISHMDDVAKDFPEALWIRVYPKSPIWATVPDHGGLDVEDWINEGATIEEIISAISPHLFLNQTNKPVDPTEKPDFNKTIDKFDKYIAPYTNDLERGWEADNFAFDNGLTKRRISGSSLINLSQARKDGNGELVVVDALDILERNTEGRKWLIAGNIPLGTTMVLAACGGSGKTTLLYNFSKCIATGESWSGFRVQKGRVLVIQTDEPECDVAEKLDIAEFYNLPRGCVDFILDWRFTQIRQLKELIERNKYSLIIIDSWTAAHSGTGTDLIASTAGNNMYKLRNIAQENECTFIVVHHFNKLNDLRDSSTIGDNCSEVWKLQPWEEKDKIARDQAIMHVSKSRAGLTGKYVFQQCSMDYSWLHLGKYEDRDKPGDPAMAQLLQVLELNAGERLSASRLREQLPLLDMETILDTAEKLRRIGMCDSEQVMRKHPNGDVSRYRLYFLPSDEKNLTKKEGRHLYAI